MQKRTKKVFVCAWKLFCIVFHSPSKSSAPKRECGRVWRSSSAKIQNEKFNWKIDSMKMENHRVTKYLRINAGLTPSKP